MKRNKLALVAVSLALGFGAAAGAARSGLLGTLAIGSKGHPAATGIQVHGRWTLVVHARNGRVVARRRFENSLTPDGAYDLAGLIMGSTLWAFNDHATGPDGRSGDFGTVGGQEILLDDGTAPNSFKGCHLIVNLDLCGAEHNNGDASSNSIADWFGTGPLKVTASGATITLSASIAPPVATTFTKVETLLKLCSDHIAGLGGVSMYAPSDCGAETDYSDPGDAGWWPFTSKTLATPLAVAAGQSVTATVQLSFS